MNNLFRGLLSGYGAMKLGGGCLGTIAVFAIIWLITREMQLKLSWSVSV